MIEQDLFGKPLHTFPDHALADIIHLSKVRFVPSADSCNAGMGRNNPQILGIPVAGWKHGPQDILESMSRAAAASRPFFVVVCFGATIPILQTHREISSKSPNVGGIMSSILLRVYVTPFAEKGVEEAAKWSCDAAKEVLNVVNEIWLKAKIAFVINDCVIDKPLDMAKSARNSDRGLLDVLSLRHKPDNLVHIYLVNSIENLSAGGSSYPDSDPEPASFVQWYGGVVASGRAWAHELGHLMSLDHVEINYADEKQAALRSNLMTKGLSMGRDLTAKQIGRVKASKLVKRFGG